MTFVDFLLALVLVCDWMSLVYSLSCYDCGMSSSSRTCNVTQRLQPCKNTNDHCITARYYEQLGNTYKYIFFKGCMEASLCENYCNKLPFDALQCMSKCCQKDKCNALSNERWIWHEHFQSHATMMEVSNKNLIYSLLTAYLLISYIWFKT